MDKFGRNYKLTVRKNTGGDLVIEPPFTVEFDITRNYMASTSSSSIRIYNLSEKNRAELRKDYLNTDVIKYMEFQAGYGKDLGLAVRGTVSHAWSVRQGTNFITEIQSFDGGFAFQTAKFNKTYPEGTQRSTIINDMASDLKQYGIDRGAIGQIDGALTRGNSYSGSTISLLRELTGDSFFIDNGKVYVLGENEVIEGSLKVINSASGLLGTPTRQNAQIVIEMIFEPRLQIGQAIRLESIGESNYNSFYKVVALKHRGTISETVGGQAITNVTLIPVSRQVVVESGI